MKQFRYILLTMLLMVLAVATLTACGDAEDTSLQVNPPPETTAEVIPEGVFYLRCSEPEDNRFAIQFIGAVPDCYVDYVGFEACIVYPDGKKGQRTVVRVTTLYKEITDSVTGELITSEDFGIEDGYLYIRALEKIPTDNDELYYEISSYYVVGKEKTYTAMQTFSIKDLLYEHILSNPQPFEVKEESPLLEVQKWVKQTYKRPETQDETLLAEYAKLSDTYYIGSSAPDVNSKLKMTVCFALPSANNNSSGIRYNFTETQGDFKGVSTSVRRVRTYTLYEKVITETETLTIEDFGLTEGYLAVVTFEDDVNTISCKTYQLNLLIYYSRNALEFTVAESELLFGTVSGQTVISPYNTEVITYTYNPADFGEWLDYSAANGSAEGDGLFKIRFSTATNKDGAFKFSMQIATAVPTRFASRIAFVYSAYDEKGDPVDLENREIAVSTLYPTIFGNGNANITPADFDMERGYIMTMLLNNVAMHDNIHTFKIEAYYRNGDEKVYLTSLMIDKKDLTDHVEIVW